MAAQVRRTRQDFKENHIRGSGPGGQHKNKVSTGVRLTDKATGLTAESTDSRSQDQNREQAFMKLAWKLVEHYQEQERHQRVENHDGNAATIRTYHEPDNRVTDHRTGTKASYKEVVSGSGLDRFIDSGRGL